MLLKLSAPVVSQHWPLLPFWYKDISWTTKFLSNTCLQVPVLLQNWLHVIFKWRKMIIYEIILSDSVKSLWTSSGMLQAWIPGPEVAFVIKTLAIIQSSQQLVSITLAFVVTDQLPGAKAAPQREPWSPPANCSRAGVFRQGNTNALKSRHFFCKAELFIIRSS